MRASTAFGYGLALGALLVVAVLWVLVWVGVL